VSGAIINSKTLNNMFMEEVETINSECSNNDTHVCALIDSFGYIIASNQNNKYTGRFIGERIGPLVDYFNKTGVFKTVQLRDTQAECSLEEESNSAANVLLTPAKMLLGALSIFFNSVYWLSVQVVIVIASLIEHQNNVAKAQVSNSDSTMGCTMTREYYVLTGSSVDWTPYTCPECDSGTSQEQQPKFTLKKVPYTNVYLLMASTGSERCGCFDGKVLPRDKEIVRGQKEWCAESKQKYRKAPSTCYNETKMNQKEKCGSAANVYPSLVAIVITACVTVSMLIA